MRWCYYVYIYSTTTFGSLDRTLAVYMYQCCARQPPHALTGDDTNMGWWWWWWEMDRHPCTHAHAHARTGPAHEQQVCSDRATDGEPPARWACSHMHAWFARSIGVVGWGHRPSASIDRCPAGSHTTRAHMTRLNLFIILFVCLWLLHIRKRAIGWSNNKFRMLCLSSPLRSSHVLAFVWHLLILRVSLY
jgi:hypothetical protein